MKYPERIVNGSKGKIPDAGFIAHFRGRIKEREKNGNGRTGEWRREKAEV
jgi:hypothetical protein